MSNLIKASQIAYAENVRTIDMNKRAEAFAQEYIDGINAQAEEAAKQLNLQEVSKKLEEERVITPDDVNFTPGIMTEHVFLNEEESEASTESAVVEVESRLREKQRELEELQRQILEVQQEAASIIEDANAKAQEIIDAAAGEAEERKQEIIELAKQEGYAAGMEEAREENERALAQIEEDRQRYREEYEKQVDAMEPAFVEIIIKYIQKLTGIYADDKREIILHLIDNAMKDKHGIESFIIRVSEADFAMASYSKDSIRGYLSDGANVEVVADRLLSKNQCLIETESRIFDCSLDGQLLSLIEDIRLLAEKE